MFENIQKLFLFFMPLHTREQAINPLRGHGAERVDDRGRIRTLPPDPDATLKKFNVANSGLRDNFGPEGTGPVSSQTRHKMAQAE